MRHIPCVILAGGQSRRMGRDKALLPFGDFDTLTEFQLHKFQPHIDKVYISCKDKSKFDFDANFIEDNPNYHDSAPLIALLSCFETLKNNDAIFVLSVDTPFVNIEHFQKLLLSYEKGDVIVAKTPQNTHPLCAIYKRKALPMIQKQLQQKVYRLSTLLEQTSTIYVDFEEQALLNLNLPSQYQHAKEQHHG